MSNKTRLLLTALLIAFNIPTAAAQWRAEAYAGKFFPLRSDLEIRGPRPGDRITFYSVEWEDRSFDSPLYYGFRIGRYGIISKRSGLELEFIHAKVYSDPAQRLQVEGMLDGAPVEGLSRLGDRLQRFSLSHGLNFLLGNVVWRPARREDDGFFSRNGVHALMRFGAGWTLPHTESVMEGLGREQYEFGGPAVQGSISCVLPLTRGFSVNLEYKFTHARLRGLGLANGEANLVINGSHLVFGPVYLF